MGQTKIEWCDKSWNVITGCSPVSEGCAHCYAKRMATRLKGRYGYPKNDPFKVTFHPDRLDEPLHWKKPSRIFVCSMGDLFHEDVSDNWIDQIFAVIALTPIHTYLLLTKRPERMEEYLCNPLTPFRIAKKIDETHGLQEIRNIPLEIRPLTDYPGYFISNRGQVYSSNGSSICIYCGNLVKGIATRKYCSTKCRQNAHYHRKQRHHVGFESTLKEMSCDIGNEGHRRVWLYKKGEQKRELVHRLVLATFDRLPVGDEQACHKDGNPEHNYISNLRWGTHEDNWEDRKRHGNAYSHGKRTIQPPPINWPIKNCFTGVSVENQRTADERIPILLQIPAAKRFISVEPMLGEIDFVIDYDQINLLEEGIDWVICGGETGPGARPLHPYWVRDLLRQCQAAGVPFFFKQMSRKQPIPKDLRIREYPK